jgi:hypothetical protein
MSTPFAWWRDGRKVRKHALKGAQLRVENHCEGLATLAVLLRTTDPSSPVSKCNLLD